MKTKITALFIAVLMILSSVLMVSCGESKTPKELFLSANEQLNSLSFGEESFSLDNFEINGEATLDKIAVGGEDLLSGAIKLAASAIHSGNDTEFEAGITYGDSNFVVNGVTKLAENSEMPEIYVKLGELFDKYVKINVSELSEITDTSDIGIDAAAIRGLTESLKSFVYKVNEIEQAQFEAIDEEKFVKTTGDITVGNVTVKNAETVTLDLSAEDFDAILKTITDAILETEEYDQIVNGIISIATSLGAEDVSYDESAEQEIKDSIDKFIADIAIDAKIAYTFVDDELIGGSADIGIMYQEQKVDFTIDCINSDDKAAIFNIELDGEQIMNADFRQVNGEIDGVVEFEYEETSFKAVCKKTDSELSASVDYTQDGTEKTLFTLAMTSEDGKKYEGSVDFNVNYAEQELPISIKVFYESGEKTATFGITEVKTTLMGLNLSVPANITVTCNQGEKEMSAEIDVDIKAEGMAEIKAHASVEVKEAGQTTVTLPTDFYTTEEFVAMISGEEGLADLQGKFLEKYPDFQSLIENAAALIGGLIGGDSDWDDDDWDDDGNWIDETEDITAYFYSPDDEYGFIMINYTQGYAYFEMPISAEVSGNALDIEVYGNKYSYDISKRNDEYDPTVETDEDGYTWQSLGYYDIASLIFELGEEGYPDGFSLQSFANYSDYGILAFYLFDDDYYPPLISATVSFTDSVDNTLYFDNGEDGITGSVTLNYGSQEDTVVITVTIDQLDMTFTTPDYVSDTM